MILPRGYTIDSKGHSKGGMRKFSRSRAKSLYDVRYRSVSGGREISCSKMKHREKFLSYTDFGEYAGPKLGSMEEL